MAISKLYCQVAVLMLQPVGTAQGRPHPIDPLGGGPAMAAESRGRRGRVVLRPPRTSCTEGSGLEQSGLDQIRKVLEALRTGALRFGGERIHNAIQSGGWCEHCAAIRPKEFFPDRLRREPRIIRP